MKTIICSLLAMTRYMIPGSSIAKCGTRGESVVISVATLATKDPGDELLCVPCLDRRSLRDREPIQIIPLTEWQKRELQACGVNVEAAQ